MSKGVVLHKTLGLNPKIIQHQCPLCATVFDGEIVLLGASNYRDKCGSCGAWVYGGLGKSQACPNCKARGSRAEREVLSEHDKFIPGPHEICKNCKHGMEVGIVFICVESHPKDPKNPRRLGRMVAIKEEAVRKMLDPGPLLDSILKQRAALVPENDWIAMGLPMEPVGETKP